jgi:hypothetical protein
VQIWPRKKKEEITTVRNPSYLIDFNIKNSFTGYHKQILLNNRDESSPLFYYPNTKSNTLYYINYIRHIDKNHIPITKNDSTRINITKKQSDSIFNLSVNFINNYKITDEIKLINGTNKSHFHNTDDSYISVMINCNERTLVAIIENIGTSEHKTNEFNNLYNYLLKLEEKFSKH